jgi:hypothetical protein
MIDTDKYEGHSEGEWKVGARKGAMTVRDSNGEEIAATNSYPNARIMADAPLLLEEVKRFNEMKQWKGMANTTFKNSNELRMLY